MPEPPRVPFIAQRADHDDCGLVCLAMVLAAHGLPGDPDALAVAAPVRPGGVDALTLRDLARHHGFDAEGIHIESETVLDTLPLPAILHWDGNHYVVLESVQGNDATLVDPRTGRRTLPRDQIRLRSGGVALLIMPRPASAAAAARSISTSRR